jgi:hypothetical protein
MNQNNHQLRSALYQLSTQANAIAEYMLHADTTLSEQLDELADSILAIPKLNARLVRKLGDQGRHNPWEKAMNRIEDELIKPNAEFRYRPLAYGEEIKVGDWFIRPSDQSRVALTAENLAVCTGSLRFFRPGDLQVFHNDEVAPQ